MRYRHILLLAFLIAVAAIVARGVGAPGPVVQPKPAPQAALESASSPSNAQEAPGVKTLRIDLHAVAAQITQDRPVTVRVWNGKRLYGETALWKLEAWKKAVETGLLVPLSRTVSEKELGQLAVEIILPGKIGDCDWLSKVSLFAIATDGVENLMHGTIDVAKDADNNHVVRKDLIALPEYPTDSSPKLKQLNLSIYDPAAKDPAAKDPAAKDPPAEDPAAKPAKLLVIVIQGRRIIALRKIEKDWEQQAVVVQGPPELTGGGLSLPLDRRKLTEGVAGKFAICILPPLENDKPGTQPWKREIDVVGIADDGVTSQLVSKAQGTPIEKSVTISGRKKEKEKEKTKERDKADGDALRKAKLEKKLQDALSSGSDLAAIRKELEDTEDSLNKSLARIQGLDREIQELAQQLDASELRQCFGSDSERAMLIWQFKDVTAAK